MLSAAGTPPLVLLAAPTGYGKTTLLREWSELDERPFAWLNAGAADNEPLVLMDGIAERLERAKVIAPGTIPQLSAKGVSRPASTWAALRRALGGIEKPFVLVLDDAEALKAREAVEFVSALIEHMPAGSQLAVATRRRPAIAIGRLRADRRLAEITAADLAMTRAE